MDPGLDEGREIVDIPVLSLGEVRRLFACLYGKRFAVVTYLPQMNVEMYDELVKKYGLESRAWVRGLFEIGLDALGQFFKDPTMVLKQFKKGGKLWKSA